MLDFSVILEINKKAIESIKSDSDGELIIGKWKNFVFYFLFYVFPFSIAIWSWYKNIHVSNLEGYISTGIAIFTGLFFSLLLTIGSKVRTEKENKDIDNNNFQSFKTSMKQISNITLYVIVLGILIFLLILLNNLLKSDNYIHIEKVFTFVVLFLLARFIVSLFFMVQRLYFLIRDELDNIL